MLKCESARTPAPRTPSTDRTRRTCCTRSDLRGDGKRESAEKKKRERAFKALKDRVAELEARIAEREKAIKDVEQTMSRAGLLQRPRKVEAGPGPAPGVDVGGRRAPGPVGDAPKRS